MNKCQATLEIGHFRYQCCRREGHKDTGHEYVGEHLGEHIHIVWGAGCRQLCEPEGGDDQ